MKKIAVAYAIICVVNLMFALSGNHLSECFAWLTAMIWAGLYYLEIKNK
jgi:hypothetical protein